MPVTKTLKWVYPQKIQEKRLKNFVFFSSLFIVLLFRRKKKKELKIKRSKGNDEGKLYGTAMMS